MFMHPATATALAEQHRQDLTALTHTRPARTIRRSRFAAVLAALAAALVAAIAGPTAAFAVRYPLPANAGWGTSRYAPPPVVHTVIVGGMPGWQIALIAAVAALAAAAVAVLLDRARRARRAHPTTA
jgi:hypothetical protein